MIFAWEKLQNSKFKFQTGLMPSSFKSNNGNLMHASQYVPTYMKVSTALPYLIQKHTDPIKCPGEVAFLERSWGKGGGGLFRAESVVYPFRNKVLQ